MAGVSLGMPRWCCRRVSHEVMHAAPTYQGIGTDNTLPSYNRRRRLSYCHIPRPVPGSTCGMDTTIMTMDVPQSEWNAHATCSTSFFGFRSICHRFTSEVQRRLQTYWVTQVAACVQNLSVGSNFAHMARCRRHHSTAFQWCRYSWCSQLSDTRSICTAQVKPSHARTRSQSMIVTQACLPWVYVCLLPKYKMEEG